MNKDKLWIQYTWYCPCCGNMVRGYQNKLGFVKVKCQKCHTVMIRTKKNQESDTFHVFTSGFTPDEVK